MKNKFYITTSIVYTNAPPHIGFALELVQADVMARYRRLLGDDVFFLTGADEHGAKIVRAAKEAGKTPKKFTDEISQKYKELTKSLNLSNDDFIRTTDQKRHWPSVQKVWLKLKENGDIYKKKYRGLYCVGCEAFAKEKDLVDGRCPIHKQKPETIEEENYFFRLSKYADIVKEKIISGEIKIVPDGRKNEIVSFISQGVEDVSCSRSKENLQWGIPVPDDDTQITYVWFEALINYLSALGYDKNSAKFKKYWPADVHCIGKDISRFHALLWPAMLLSLGLDLPKTIFVHGYITSSGQKMSKSLGNVVDPFELIKKYGVDAVRYFLLREIPSTEDGDFTYEKFIGRYNADLANGIGNTISRILTMIRKYYKGEIKGEEVGMIKDEIWRSISVDSINSNLREFYFHLSLAQIIFGFKQIDKDIEDRKPWKLDKKTLESTNYKNIFYTWINSIKELTRLLTPFLPETSEKILKQLKTRKSEPLFPRI